MSTGENIRPITIVAAEPTADPTAPFRERIAVRSIEHDATYPRAVELEARVLRAMHGVLHGVSTLLRGLHSPRRFRELLMGERNMPLSDICRLATEPTREARTAALAAVRELAGALGFKLEAIDQVAAEEHEALAGTAAAAGALMAGWSRALANDGRMDATEARDLEPQLEAVGTQLTRMRATVQRAKGGETE